MNGIRLIIASKSISFRRFCAPGIALLHSVKAVEEYTDRRLLPKATSKRSHGRAVTRHDLACRWKAAVGPAVGIGEQAAASGLLHEKLSALRHEIRGLRAFAGWPHTYAIGERQM